MISTAHSIIMRWCGGECPGAAVQASASAIVQPPFQDEVIRDEAESWTVRHFQPMQQGY